MKFLFSAVFMLTFSAFVSASNSYTKDVCPEGYQLFQTITPPLTSETLTCSYFEDPSDVRECYWANQATTGEFIFGIKAKGDCTTLWYATSDQYNLAAKYNLTDWDHLKDDHEGVDKWAIYIAGIKFDANTDQKYCCISKKHKVKPNTCSGGSSRKGGYRYASFGGDLTSVASVDIKTITSEVTGVTMKRNHPIVRMFVDGGQGDYDYTFYVCDTEEAVE